MIYARPRLGCSDSHSNKFTHYRNRCYYGFKRIQTKFVEILQLAMAYGESHVSEKGIEQALIKDVITKEDLKNPAELRSKLQAFSFYLVTGLAGQDAAIAAIPSLAERYPILRPSARAALESLSSTNTRKEIVQSALDQLNKLR